jgi:hypothetical protein
MPNSSTTVSCAPGREGQRASRTRISESSSYPVSPDVSPRTRLLVQQMLLIAKAAVAEAEAVCPNAPLSFRQQLERIAALLEVAHIDASDTEAPLA